MLIGHDDKIRIFKSLVENGNLGHAYLFFGDAGIGKNLFARALANFLENGEFKEPTQPLTDSSVFAPGEKSTIGIDDVLKQRRFLSMTPLRSKRRIAIVEASFLTKEAQSAMLKIVEEPPSMAMVIFVAHDPRVLFPPLLSRLTKVYFNRLSREDLKKVLVEIYEISPKKAEELAPISFGRIGRALNLVEGKKTGGEDDLGRDLEEEIVRLRNKDLLKNSAILDWLLGRLELVRHYNLNMRLQRAAISYKLSQRT